MKKINRKHKIIIALVVIGISLIIYEHFNVEDHKVCNERICHSQALGVSSK